VLWRGLSSLESLYGFYVGLRENSKVIYLFPQVYYFVFDESLGITCCFSMLTCLTLFLLYFPTVSSTSSTSNINGDVPVSEPTKSGNLSAGFSGSIDLHLDGSPLNNAELSFFNFSSIVIATNNFSEENKLGQGGFGPVYKVNM